ncbi:hypothetical protein TSOC_008456 [Tetrabaena socialis]|uniref:Uncharacterized protein n=1 Tax=Tetrabaena socialis TaxID=47790 RepID=A0A2J7ZYD1_9CHLO|nr:hypothetical protein TSOC_008456 [Tetrabaena socialis]|eukprot:PNH05279.1 hypothetical protein TSOC_008456 [Tetrabaena socialis]
MDLDEGKEDTANPQPVAAHQGSGQRAPSPAAETDALMPPGPEPEAGAPLLPLPAPLPLSAAAVAALTACPHLPSATTTTTTTTPGGGGGSTCVPDDATLQACRAQAALAELYCSMSDIELLSVPYDVYVPVSGPCLPGHRAAFACARPLSLGMNLMLQQPRRTMAAAEGCASGNGSGGGGGAGGGGEQWVVADAVCGQEELPGMLLCLMGAEAEGGGYGSGEPAGALGGLCAAAAATSAARLAARAIPASAAASSTALLLPLTSPTSPLVASAAGPQQHQTDADLLALLHGVLLASTPGILAAGTGGREAAAERLGALTSICRAEAARQHVLARMAGRMRRPPAFSHYLTTVAGTGLDGRELAVLQRMAVYGAGTGQS